MLKGYFKVEGHIYNLRGYDFEDSISLYISSPVTKSRLYLDKGILVGEDVYPPSWEDLYVSIGLGFIKVDCHLEKENGVTYKNRINTEALSLLGSVIRGMKSGANRSNRVDGDLFDITFNPTESMDYSYGEGNIITLRLNKIMGLKYKDDFIEVELEDDGLYVERIWRLTNTQHKLKLDLSKFIVNVNTDDSWDFSDDKVFSLQEIIERNPHKSYVWLKERKYHIVKTMEDLELICKKIWQHDGLVAFDTETTGLNVNITSRRGDGDRLVGMVFSITPGEAYYFPVAHKKVQNICNSGNEHYIIEKYFKPLLEKKDLLCHNGSYDWKVMYNYGICCNIVHDTLILFKVTLWNDHRNLSLGLKDLTHTFLNRDSFELSDFVVGSFGSNNIKFWDLEEESVKYYACPDTDNLLELFQYTVDSNLLTKYDAKKTYEIEVAFSLVIAYQEYYGHYVDLSKVDKLVADILKDKSYHYSKLVERVGMDFNPRSNKDLPNVCFNILGLPEFGYTDAGNKKADKDARQYWLGLSSVSEEDKEFVRNLNSYLDAATLESNFTKKLDTLATPDGLMFSEVKQFLETGRVSSTNPNYQGYSNTVKKYVGPRPGYYGMDADYSSVEARIMCSMAGCSNMIDGLKDPDADYHKLKASDMFNIPYELVTSELRQLSKGVNFGLLYGMGDPNLGVNLFGEKTPENTRKAKRQKELYFKGMEELKDFISFSRAQGVNNGYSTTYFNRRRYYNLATTRKDSIERQSCNARIQGTAADIYKLAMVRLFNRIKENNWLGKVLITAFVHDECFLEVSKEIDPFVMLRVLRESMMLNIEGWCPLFIGAGYGRNWYEAKKTEIPVQVQDYFVDNFGSSGVEWWSGDTSKLCDYVVNCISLYKRERVLSYVKNSENWGKVLKPTENDLAHSLLNDIKKGIVVEGAITSDVHPSKDMIENLREFCRVFDCLDVFERADIKAPTNNSNSLDMNSDEHELLSDDINPRDILLARLNTIGVHLERRSNGGTLYFKYNENNATLMNLLKQAFSRSEGNIEVVAVKDDGCDYSTGITTGSSVYPEVLKLYLSYNTIMNRG